MSKKKRIFIIGGGAAGFFTAANLDENKYYVTILEQNSDVLQKVKISTRLSGRIIKNHAKKPTSQRSFLRSRKYTTQLRTFPTGCGQKL